MRKYLLVTAPRNPLLNKLQILLSPSSDILLLKWWSSLTKRHNHSVAVFWQCSLHQDSTPVQDGHPLYKKAFLSV